MTKKLNKFILITFILFFMRWEQAFCTDHLILQDLDTANNLATICQDGGGLCSDVEVVNFDDLNRDQKDQMVEMIASSSIDGYFYNTTLELDQFSNFLSHSDEISYSSDLNDRIETTALLIFTTSNLIITTSLILFILKTYFP